MSASKKEVRRAAIEAERQRRFDAMGIPEHLQVYVLGLHHADEGGPRTFAPAACVRNLEQDIRDRGLLARLIQAARGYGTPIEMMLDDEDCFKPGVPVSDFSVFGGSDGLMIFSRRMADALRDLLAPCGHFLPLACPGFELVGFQLTAAEADILDPDKCRINWRNPITHDDISEIYTYAFHTDRLGRHAMFRLRQHYRELVLHPFVEIVRKNGFTGMRFYRVWPMLPGIWWDKSNIVG